MTASPVNLIYGNIWTMNDDTWTAIDVGVTMDLTFYITCFDLQTLNESA